MPSLHVSWDQYNTLVERLALADFVIARRCLRLAVDG